MNRLKLRELAHNNLCVRDQRSPEYAWYHDPEDPRPPRQDCHCDHCFYGKDKLALAILQLLDEND